MTSHSITVQGPVEIRLTVTPLPVEVSEGGVVAYPLLGAIVSFEPGVGAVVENAAGRWFHVDTVDPSWMRAGDNTWVRWETVTDGGPPRLILPAI